MLGKNKQEHQDLKNFKSMALWLLAYKLFRDYIDLVNFHQRPEPEKFFEVWVARAMPTNIDYSDKDKSNIWRLFLDLLIARAEHF